MLCGAAPAGGSLGVAYAAGTCPRVELAHCRCSVREQLACVHAWLNSHAHVPHARMCFACCLAASYQGICPLNYRCALPPFPAPTLLMPSPCATLQIIGGSFISTGQLCSKFARYQFRPHFFQHAGFRVVVPEVDLSLYDMTKHSAENPLRPFFETSCMDAGPPYVGDHSCCSKERRERCVLRGCRLCAHGECKAAEKLTASSSFPYIFRQTHSAVLHFRTCKLFCLFPCVVFFAVSRPPCRSKRCSTAPRWRPPSSATRLTRSCASTSRW